MCGPRAKGCLCVSRSYPYSALPTAVLLVGDTSSKFEWLIVCSPKVAYKIMGVHLSNWLVNIQVGECPNLQWTIRKKHKKIRKNTISI